MKEILENLARVGISANVDQIVPAAAPPNPVWETADPDGEMVDAYWHWTPEMPWHFGRYLIWPETEHFCSGPEYRFYHVMAASENRPSGGNLPQPVINALAYGFGGLTRQAIWDLAPSGAREHLRSNPYAASAVASAIVSGQLEEGWLDGAKASGSAWLRDMLPLAYQRGANPLPLLRRIFPKPEWTFTRTEPHRVDKGIYPTYGNGEIIAVFPVKNGWVTATAPKGSAQDNCWL